MEFIQANLVVYCAVHSWACNPPTNIWHETWCTICSATTARWRASNQTMTMLQDAKAAMLSNVFSDKDSAPSENVQGPPRTRRQKRRAEAASLMSMALNISPLRYDVPEFHYAHIETSHACQEPFQSNQLLQSLNHQQDSHQKAQVITPNQRNYHLVQWHRVEFELSMYNIDQAVLRILKIKIGHIDFHNILKATRREKTTGTQFNLPCKSFYFLVAVSETFCGAQ